MDTLEQPLYVLEPIVLTFFGINIEVNFEHPENAYPPIIVTLFGMMMEVKEEHPQNAHIPIVVVPSSITIDSINSLLLYQGTEEGEEKYFISPFPFIVNAPSARMALQSVPHSHSSHFTERRNIENTKMYF